MCLCVYGVRCEFDACMRTCIEYVHAYGMVSVVCPIMCVYLSVCVCVHECSELKIYTDVSDYTSLEFDRWQVWLN